MCDEKVKPAVLPSILYELFSLMLAEHVPKHAANNIADRERNV
jgi:hypothetical protein